MTDEMTDEQRRERLSALYRDFETGAAAAAAGVLAARTGSDEMQRAFGAYHAYDHLTSSCLNILARRGFLDFEPAHILQSELWSLKSALDNAALGLAGGRERQRAPVIAYYEPYAATLRRGYHALRAYQRAAYPPEHKAEAGESEVEAKARWRRERSVNPGTALDGHRVLRDMWRGGEPRRACAREQAPAREYDGAVQRALPGGGA